jgi:hypothetical protein
VCQASQFVLTAATDQSTYRPGEPIVTTLTLRDTSSQTCVDTDVEMGGCYGTDATTSAGVEVWESWAGPDGLPENCPEEGIPPTVPGGAVYTSADIVWTQDDCTQPVSVQPNPDCPQTPVAPGVYEISGFWANFGPAPPVTITIAS